MDHATEVDFAWALLGAARCFLEESAHSWLCASLGAGETRRVIRDLLTGYVSTNTPVPAVLVAALWSWANGFTGSDEQSTIRDTIARIQLKDIAKPGTEHGPPVAKLIARSGGLPSRTTLRLLPTGG